MCDWLLSDTMAGMDPDPNCPEGYEPVQVTIVTTRYLPIDLDVRRRMYGTVEVRGCIEIDWDTDPAGFVLDDVLDFQVEHD